MKQTQWFGESWGAPICDEAQRVETPDGEVCPQCTRTIRPGHQGVVMPYETADGGADSLAFHRACLLGWLGIALDSPMTDDKPDTTRAGQRAAIADIIESGTGLLESNTEQPNDDQAAAEHVWALAACPHCGKSLVGPEVPDNRRATWKGVTNYSRLIAIYDRELDRTTHFECPDCRGRIERDGGKG